MGLGSALVDAVRRRFGGALEDPDGDTPVRAHRPILVDANTQTFWSRGASAPTTLVETDAAAESTTRPRLSAMLAEHERGTATGGRPRGNPAFSEALFVELMRAEQYQRAFALLTPDCQKRWASADRFAAANRSAGLRQLRGVNVVSVRYLPEWVDPDQELRHTEVAELDVEYAFGDGERSAAVRRTVHLVGVEGRWRSLCYPVETGRRTS